MKVLKERPVQSSKGARAMPDKRINPADFFKYKGPLPDGMEIHITQLQSEVERLRGALEAILERTPYVSDLGDGGNAARLKWIRKWTTQALRDGESDEGDGGG